MQFNSLLLLRLELNLIAEGSVSRVLGLGQRVLGDGLPLGYEGWLASDPLGGEVGQVLLLVLECFSDLGHTFLELLPVPEFLHFAGEVRHAEVGGGYFQLH